MPKKIVKNDFTSRAQTFQRCLRFKYLYSLASVDDFEVAGHKSSSQTKQ
jgi:hypothetical protein